MKPMKTSDGLEPNIFVIFGGAGDLAWRKLIPALFDLAQDRSQPAQFAIIAVDRIKLGDAALRRRWHDGVNQFSRFGKAKTAAWNLFAQHIHYQHGDFKQPSTYAALGRQCTKLEKQWGAKPGAFSTWPHRRACSVKSQNISAMPDWRAIASGRGS
jgi:glucose-6-phosphate 1-dehydrogenase